MAGATLVGAVARPLLSQSVSSHWRNCNGKATSSSGGGAALRRSHVVVGSAERARVGGLRPSKICGGFTRGVAARGRRARVSGVIRVLAAVGGGGNQSSRNGKGNPNSVRRRWRCKDITSTRSVVGACVSTP